tara:strand:+ start:412 stop:1512 length:1101 start_codon:yes stop_codon:yes gene_type:complete
MASLLRHFFGVTEKPVTPDPKMKLIVRAQIGDNSSYDFHTQIIVDGLLKRKWELCLIPYNDDAWTRIIPKRYDRILARQPQYDAPTLIIHPPKQHPDDPQRTIYSTMWETTRIPQNWVGNLNRCKALIIPTMANMLALSGQGVTAPMHKVEFGIDTDAFQPREFPVRKHLVFGTSGITRHGWPRKGFDECVEAFTRAFPTGREKVELHCKAYPKDPLPGFTDGRIVIDQGEFPKDKLADWYASLDVYLCMSRGEGWGLMPHEAAAMGRPSILPMFFGFSEYMQADMCYPVEYDLVPATHYYEGNGAWAEPDVDHAAQIMRHIYNNQDELIAKSKASAKRAREYSYTRMVDGYAKVIEKYFPKSHGY